ncbi:hypothetical protein C8R45DRAFT_1185182 [Mycena sanguinolenta]|nr:hypothetical protein C8R45DRAFT_1185182 [Mycena sanguinolenta]
MSQSMVNRGFRGKSSYFEDGMKRRLEPGRGVLMELGIGFERTGGLQAIQGETAEGSAGILEALSEKIERWVTSNASLSGFPIAGAEENGLHIDRSSFIRKIRKIFPLQPRFRKRQGGQDRSSVIIPASWREEDGLMREGDTCKNDDAFSNAMGWFEKLGRGNTETRVHLLFLSTVQVEAPKRETGINRRTETQAPIRGKTSSQDATSICRSVEIGDQKAQ